MPKNHSYSDMRFEDVQRFNTLRAEHPAPARFSGSIKIGHWLRRWQGHIVDGYRLCAERNRHLNQWRYYFIAVADLPPDSLELRDAIEFEARMKTHKTSFQKIPAIRRKITEPPPRAKAAESAPPSGGNATYNSEGKEIMRTADPKTGEPVETTFTTRMSSSGKLIQVPDLPAPKALETPPVPKIQTGDYIRKNDSLFPPWVVEGRAPTVLELTRTHQVGHVRPRSDEPAQEWARAGNPWDGNGAGEVASNPSGQRLAREPNIGPGSSGWRNGGSNWRQKL